MAQVLFLRAVGRMSADLSYLVADGLAQQGYLRVRRKLHHFQIIKPEKSSSDFARAIGIEGSKKIPGVSLTYSNGIYNFERSCQSTAERISRTHGHVEVTYVHHPSVNFWTDVRRASKLMLIGRCKHVQTTAEALLNLWNQRMQEMSVEFNKPKIIHYGHSLGAIIAYIAAQNFPFPQSLDLRLFGSPWLLPPHSFGSVKHVIATQDPVTWLTFLQLRRLSLKGGILKTVPFKVGPQRKISPLALHIEEVAYGKVLETMGESFILHQETLSRQRLNDGHRMLCALT